MSLRARPTDKRADPLTPAQRSYTMAQVKGKDTKPEIRVRRLVHGMGYRYRLHRTDLPGKPDLTFPSRRKVIFVHGCFWHGHNCKAGMKRPRSNQAYWPSRLERNKTRDKANRTRMPTGDEQEFDLAAQHRAERLRGL